jgi:hypothetical protein
MMDEALSDFAAARSPSALARMVGRRLVPDSQVVATEGGGRSVWAFWPVWAVRRIIRSLGRAGHRSGAKSAAEVMRWIQA